MYPRGDCVSQRRLPEVGCTTVLTSHGHIMHTYWHHNSPLHGDSILVMMMSICCCHMQYFHGNSCWNVDQLSKRTPAYTMLFKIARCAMCFLNSWFETNYYLNYLCDNKNVKFNCFNLHKTVAPPTYRSILWTYPLQLALKSHDLSHIIYVK